MAREDLLGRRTQWYRESDTSFPRHESPFVRPVKKSAHGHYGDGVGF